MNVLALFLYWVLARTQYRINKVLRDTNLPDPKRFIGVQANIRLLHTQNPKRFRRLLHRESSLGFSLASQANTAVRLCLVKGRLSLVRGLEPLVSIRYRGDVCQPHRPITSAEFRPTLPDIVL